MISAGRSPMPLPQCGNHGEMELRTRASKESAWCGVWYDCPRCTSSVLFPSKELQSQLAEQGARQPAQRQIFMGA